MNRKIVKILNKDLNEFSYHDRLIFGLYTLIPCRRVNDIHNLYLTYSNENHDKDKNYIMINDSKYSLIYYTGKNSKNMGTQIIEITNDVLIKLIDEHVDNSKLIENNKIFKYSHSTKFGSVCSNIFTHVYGKSSSGKKVSVNTIRHSYISWCVNVKKYDLNTLNNIAKCMGHSYTMQSCYVWK